MEIRTEQLNQEAVVKTSFKCVLKCYLKEVTCTVSLPFQVTVMTLSSHLGSTCGQIFGQLCEI